MLVLLLDMVVFWTSAIIMGVFLAYELVVSLGLLSLRG